MPYSLPLRTMTVLALMIVAGCSSHTRDEANGDNVKATHRAGEPDLIPVIAALHDQMYSWEGTPYQWGGTELSGVDCSGFVWRTLKDRFNLPMKRVTTSQLIHMGTRIQPDRLQPGDLVFFRVNRQMHVGFYDTDRHFLHASASRGVMRSSLDNVYWKSVFLEARRLPNEHGAQISFNYDDEDKSALAKN
ncbi:NlpC/P60 family protein [Erwinia sp.]|uniref:C40 family peptidase n=1 Tax=Erwinia citreus TaxID=558 RepID=UPI0028A0DC87|nr:NlpC/P60 family protein [Erwinia sp.]